jgi:hypothetical protein
MAIMRLNDVVPFVGTAPDAFFAGTREAWLQKIVDIWRPYFGRVGPPLPARILISVGQPPSIRSVAVCYPGEASDDGSVQIFVHPVLSDPVRVAGAVVHQLCHAALGNRHHGGAFKRLATAAGLIGKPTRTIEGPDPRPRPAAEQHPADPHHLRAVRIQATRYAALADGRRSLMPEPRMRQLWRSDGDRLTRATRLRPGFFLARSACVHPAYIFRVIFAVALISL